MKALLTLLLIVAALSGAPLFVVIAASALLWFYFMGVDLSIVVIEMYRLASNPLLIALLFFAFAGYVLAESGAGKRLVKTLHGNLWLHSWGPRCGCTTFLRFFHRTYGGLRHHHRRSRGIASAGYAGRKLSGRLLARTPYQLWQPRSSLSSESSHDHLRGCCRRQHPPSFSWLVSYRASY